MPRGEQLLVLGLWSHVDIDTAFALGCYRIQPDYAGRAG
jgi:hypothetical protein